MFAVICSTLGCRASATLRRCRSTARVRRSSRRYENVTRRYHDRPLAGILLLTDGNATDLGDRAVAWKSMPPVYPVVVGDTAPPRDVALVEFRSARRVLKTLR